LAKSPQRFVAGFSVFAAITGRPIAWLVRVPGGWTSMNL
jgi:hypothetical protein